MKSAISAERVVEAVTTYSISIEKTTDGAEDTTNTVFTVTVTPQNDSGSAITGNIAYTGTATNGTDYATGATIFNIPNGSSTATITLLTTTDTLVEGTETAIATISGASEGSISTSVATANIIDNDTAGFTLSETTASVNESGTTDSFTVVLSSQPTSDVTLDIASDNTDEATVDLATLTFTSANWNTAQTVTITGVDDSSVDGNQDSTITVSVNSSSDDTFDGFSQ